MARFVEDIVEQAALQWLGELGWQVVHGPDIAPGEPAAERNDYRQVVLRGRLLGALARINPGLPASALEDACRKLLDPAGADIIQRNRAVHKMFVDGVTVEYRASDGDIRGAQVKVIDYDTPENNDWLAVNQFTVIENNCNRRPDVVLFVNGLPLAVLELKNPADPDATLLAAFNQLQTYKSEIPTFFNTNVLMAVADGISAIVGTLTADIEWFKQWNTITGAELADAATPQLQVLIQGLFTPRNVLDMLRDFIVFADDGSRVAKKMAGYHQFHAVKTAVGETIRATGMAASYRAGEEPGTYHARGSAEGIPGDKRIGVVWHTQGSGKSLTMAFYTGRIVREPSMENPTVVVITDRNDLDDQLFNTFSQCSDLLRQKPVQAESREHLRALLNVVSGGVVFTTVHKFFAETGSQHPLLSDRRNIVVIADEAHRSQYDFIDGYARNMRDALPNASFIGFTGTPIELQDANTRAVFGDYISIYDIQRAVQDKATVPIYYESRLVKLDLSAEERESIDSDFEEVTEGEEEDDREKLKTKWAQLEAVVGSAQRIREVATDIVRHYEQRIEAMEGKAMVVCMSRRICVELYRELVRLRPEWESAEDKEGAIKIVMTGSASDPLDWQPHIRSKPRREMLADRFRDPADPFRIVIVRDMWLTGFDAPSLHTMYIDKPMRGHGLMQAIARVNRVFRDKPGGLVVDYLGVAPQLQAALATYTESGGKGKTALDKNEAVSVMLEKYDICCGIFHGFDWSAWRSTNPADRLGLYTSAFQHVLSQEDGKNRFNRAVSDLSKAFALSVPHEATMKIRDDVGFFQAIQSALMKPTPGEQKSANELDHAVRQIISHAIVSEGVVDIFEASGMKKPDISILSDEFLAEVRGMPQRNLAVELLQRLLKSELNVRMKKNVVQGRSFAELLEKTLRQYQNRAIEAAKVIEELIELAKDIREAGARGEALGLTEDELAFYDALETSDSAVKVLGDDTLRTIARELVDTVRKNVTIDWTMRESVRATLRVYVKRILRKYGYPPDKQEKATETVLEQARVLSDEWAVLG